jgi:hypothetical protein
MLSQLTYFMVFHSTCRSELERVYIGENIYLINIRRQCARRINSDHHRLLRLVPYSYPVWPRTSRLEDSNLVYTHISRLLCLCCPTLSWVDNWPDRWMRNVKRRGKAVNHNYVLLYYCISLMSVFRLKYEKSSVGELTGTM